MQRIDKELPMNRPSPSRAFAGSILALALAAAAQAQTVSVPVPPMADGHATSAARSGTLTTLNINGSAAPSVGWLTFQLAGRDLSRVTKATLALYVRNCPVAGTVRAHALTAPITAAEASVTFAAIQFDAAAVLASVPVAVADTEKVIQLDVTAAVKAATFNGLALSSNNGLVANFGSRENVVPAAIWLTYDHSGDITDVTPGPGLSGGGPNGTVTLSMANNAVTPGKLATNAVVSAALAASAVGTAALADGSVNQAKIAAGAVGEGQIAAGAVGSSKLANASVTSAKLAAGAVSTANFSANAVDASKIPDYQRVLSVTADGFMLPSNSALLRTPFGLNWTTTACFADAKIDVVKPADWSGAGVVKLTLYFIATGNGPGNVSFKAAYGSLNAGEAHGTLSKMAGTAVMPIPDGSGAGFIFKQEFTMPAADLAKEFWRVVLTRDVSSCTGGIDTFPYQVQVSAASLSYTAIQ